LDQWASRCALTQYQGWRLTGRTDCHPITHQGAVDDHTPTDQTPRKAPNFFMENLINSIKALHSTMLLNNMSTTGENTFLEKLSGNPEAKSKLSPSPTHRASWEEARIKGDRGGKNLGDKNSRLGENPILLSLALQLLPLTQLLLLIDFRQKRELRRTANNGHFLRKQGHKMFKDGNYEYDVGEKYHTNICASCDKGVEDGTHFLLECEKYQEVRDTANNQVNTELERHKVEGQHNLIKVYGDSWKGYITKDTRRAIRKAVGRDKVNQMILKILGIVSKALLDMKKLRNEHFHKRKPTMNV